MQRLGERIRDNNRVCRVSTKFVFVFVFFKRNIEGHLSFLFGE